MEKKSLYEDAPVAVQRYLLLTVVAAEAAACHLTAAGYLFVESVGVKGFALALAAFTAIGVFIVMAGMNLGSMVASVRIAWFEKDDKGWAPFARFTFPIVLGQTAISATIWLLYDQASVQLTVGSASLFLAGIFFALLRRSVRRMPMPPTEDGGADE